MAKHCIDNSFNGKCPTCGQIDMRAALDRSTDDHGEVCKLLHAERLAHAETRAELDEARRALVRDKLDAACTRAERKVLEAMAAIPKERLAVIVSDINRHYADAIAARAELARRGEK